MSPEDNRTRIASDRAGEVGVNGACETVMAKSVPRHAPGAEVLRRQHAPCGHDAHQSVEGRLAGVLEKRFDFEGGEKKRTLSDMLTTHLSSDAASAPELETSSVIPLRFLRMSCSFSKFVRGGGRCRLSANC